MIENLAKTADTFKKFRKFLENLEKFLENLEILLENLEEFRKFNSLIVLIKTVLFKLF